MPPEATGQQGGEQTFDALGDTGASSGGEAAGGNAGAGASGGNTGGAGGTGATAGGAPQFNFRDAIPAEYKEAGWLKNVNDVPTLLKNYANAQKMIGADKIPLPGPNATPEEIRGVLAKIGLPEKFEDYKTELPKELAEAVNPQFMESYRKFAHEAGLLPAQAAKVVDFLAKFSGDSEKASVEAQRAEVKKGLDGLKTEWGQAYDENIARAKAAVKEFGGDETLQYLRKNGLSNDPVILKLLAKAGEALGEDVIKGQGGTGENVLSVQQARDKIAEIKANMSHPYYKGDPEAKKEMGKLYAAAFPEPKKP